MKKQFKKYLYTSHNAAFVDNNYSLFIKKNTYILNLFLTCLLVFISSSFMYAQNLNKQFDHAHQLYKNKQYFDAVTELKRLMFFDNAKEYTYSASDLTGQCYKQGAKFSDALIWFTKAEMSAPGKVELAHVRLEKIKIFILRRNTRQALSHLDALHELIPDTNKINYWKGWAYAFNDEWNKASEYFAKSNEGSELKLLADKTHSDKYNVNAARIMSYIIPGAGQFYTGHYLSGLLSLGWNVLWGYTTINALQANRVFDGIMVANFLWLRFYTGNTYNAEQFAIEENLQISNRSLDYMQFKYKGEKP